MHYTSSYYSARTKLSYKSVDRNLFYADLDKKLTINAITAELDKPLVVQWPCAMREEEVTQWIVVAIRI